jgi:MipA family protein
LHATANSSGAGGRALLAACLAAAAPSAFSQAFDAVRLQGITAPEDRGSIGLAVLAGRQYEGSAERRTLALPLLDYQWRNGWFAGTTNGIGYNFSRTAGIDYGLRVTADFGRDEDRDDALRGVGDIKTRAEFGGFFNYELGAGFALTTSLQYGSGNDKKGLLGTAGATYSTGIAPQWRIGGGVSATYANAKYMQSYFGITPEQSAASGYAPYAPGAGIKNVRASANVTYLVNRDIAVTAGVSVSSLQGDAKDSPLARKRNDTGALIAISYGF